MSKEAKIKGKVILQDGTEVPDYEKSCRLPITTHRPHKYAIIDMESGNVFIPDPSKHPLSDGNFPMGY